MFRTFLFLMLLCTLALGACGGSTQVPTVTPRSTTITGVVTNGLAMSMDMQIHNPNGYNLTLYGLRARVTAQGRDLGNVESGATLVLTAGQWTPYASQVVVPWGELPGLAASAVLSPSIPYHVEGRVMVRGPGGYTVRVPFEMDGEIPRSMLLRSPGIIPAGIIPSGIIPGF